MNEFLKLILEEDLLEQYFDLDSSDIVTESSGVSYSDGTVIYGYFPYNHPGIQEHDKSKTDYHYGVVINHQDYGELVVMCTSVKEGTDKRSLEYLKSKKLNYVIPNETSKGFKRPTVVKGLRVLKVSDVQDRRVKGYVDANDIKEIRSRLNMFFDLRLKMIEALQNYMKLEPFKLTKQDVDGSTINNKFQTPKEMMESHLANSLDVCTIVRHVCKTIGLKHHIVHIRFLDNSKWTLYDHFYVVYFSKKTDIKDASWRPFRFFYIGKQTVGSIEPGSFNLDDVLKKEEKFVISYLKPYHPGTVSGKTILLDDEDLKKWDHLVAMKAPQKKMMDYLDNKYPGNLRKKDS